MTAPIAAISALTALSSATPAAAASTASAATSGTDFASVLGQGLDQVASAQSNAENLAVQAATGTLSDPATYTVAATQATLMTQLATTVESKAVAAFNAIMGMQA
jgi:flagellar hook-basal body complex protein FliE